MGWEWLSMLTNFVELVGSLIPQRKQIPPTDRGIKYIGHKRVAVLGPGNHWVWPWRSVIHVHNIMPRPIELNALFVTTTDGTPFQVDGAVQVSIGKDEGSVLAAFYEHDDIEEIIAAEVTNLICQLIGRSVEDELYDRSNFNRKLRFYVRKRLAKYGVRVHRCYIATLVTGRPYLLLGNSGHYV